MHPIVVVLYKQPVDESVEYERQYASTRLQYLMLIGNLKMLLLPAIFNASSILFFVWRVGEKNLASFLPPLRQRFCDELLGALSPLTQK
uniref:Anoctamin n=1 Tax=Ascaris lumbricoides TaxID=6252 RepID=A0A0M3IM52_ASCLU